MFKSVAISGPAPGITVVLGAASIAEDGPPVFTRYGPPATAKPPGPAITASAIACFASRSNPFSVAAVAPNCCTKA